MAKTRGNARGSTSKLKGPRIKFVVSGPAAIGKSRLVQNVIIPYLQVNGYDVELYEDQSGSDLKTKPQVFKRQGPRSQPSQPLVEVHVTNQNVTWGDPA